MTSKNEKIDLLRKWEPRCETFAGEVIDSPEAIHKSPFPHRGDIFWVELGENVGSEKNDFHPCIIASREGYNRFSGMVSIIPGTSAPLDPHKNPHASTYKLHRGEFIVFKSTTSKLPKKTLFQTQQIRSISRNRLLAKIGTLTENELALLKSRIKDHLAI